MSYLDVPRLHFFGRFQADPSTLNNDPCNYDPATDPLDAAWNPNGSHNFKITGCQVTSLTMPDGYSGQGDPLVGASVHSTDLPNPAKLVDLDTEQQMVSMIFGMHLQAGGAASGSFTGVFQPVCFNDIFFRVVGGRPDSVFSAYYQSVLTNVDWTNPSNSPFLKALNAASPKQLSIKFVVDGFDDQSTINGAKNSHFTFGRVVGTIGPANAAEPPNFVVGRLLRPTANPRFNFGWAVADASRNRVIVDLGNSLASSAPGGPPPNLGTLTAVVLPKGTAFAQAAAPVATLGQIDYSLTAYQNNGYVQEFPLSASLIAQIQGGAEIAIVQTPATGPASVVLQENQTCAYVNATPYVFRMNPGDTATVEVMAVQNGVASANQVITLAANNGILQPSSCHNGEFGVGVPASAVTYPATVTTSANGKAQFSLLASDPGKPRTFLDGQVYGVGFNAAALDPNPNPNWALSVKVCSSTPIPDKPTWFQDVLPILKPYARLYPFMEKIIRLDNFNKVKAAVSQIATVLRLPLDAPNHMPVTRDMSADQRNIILKWIANGAQEGTRPD